jgi:predicted DNA-binding protein (UPF0251 family)
LCRACYQWAFQHQSLANYPSVNAAPINRNVVLQRYEELCGKNLTMTEIARRIGIERTALYGALRRARCSVATLPAVELKRLRAQVGLPGTLEEAS